MRLDEDRIRRKKELLNETRELLMNVQQQYNVPVQMIPPRKPRLVRDFLKTAVQTIDSKTSLMEASKLLLSKEITHLPVVKDNKLEGIATRTDILRGFYEGKKTVEEIMTKKVVTVNLDDSVLSVVQKANKYGISIFPVVDSNGNLMGIVSTDDI